MRKLPIVAIAYDFDGTLCPGNMQEHSFIISSGLREMIEGTSIAGKFKKIYASSFNYDQNEVAEWPALAINFTTKR